MPTFRSRSELQGSGGASLTSNLVLTKPAGTVDDDYLLAIFDIDEGATGLAMSAVPAGWTLLFASGAISNGAGRYGYFWVYGKKAAGEPASWTWTLNRQIAFYECNAVSISGVNTATAYEGLSSVTAAGQASGATISRTVSTTGLNETIVTIAMSYVSSSSPQPSWSENVGVETWEAGRAVGMDVAFNMLDVASQTTQTVTATTTHTGTAALAMVQLALNAPAVNATVVAPAANATASRAAPAVAPGIGAVAARAVADGIVPFSVTGPHLVVAVAAMAVASRAAPIPSSSRIELEMDPDIGGTIELVEDT